MHPPFRYLAFTGSISSAANGNYTGVVEDTGDQVTYHARSLEGLRANFEAAVDEYVNLSLKVAYGESLDQLDEHQLFIHLSSEGVHTSKTLVR